MSFEMADSAQRIYSFNFLDLPRTISKSKSAFLAPPKSPSGSTSSTSRKVHSGGQASVGSTSKHLSGMFRQRQRSVVHDSESTTKEFFQTLGPQIFLHLVRDFKLDGGHSRNSPYQDAYSFRLVARVFYEASFPYFEQTFFTLRHGVVGCKALQPLLQVSRSRFAPLVKILVLNLFPTSWRPLYAPYADKDSDQLDRTVATYWDENRYNSWITDISADNYEETVKNELTEILSNFPHLEGICISAYSFNEFFSCSRKNYLALASMRVLSPESIEDNIEVAIKHVAKDTISFHQLLRVWNKLLEACYCAIQNTRPPKLANFKLRVPQDMWRYGNPTFPRDAYIRHRSDKSVEPWFKNIRNMTIAIMVSEPVQPKQIGQFEQTSDRWISRLLYGMQSLSSLTITSTDAEMLTPKQQSSIFNRSLVLFHSPTLHTYGLEPDSSHILPFRETPPWTWPTLDNLTSLTLADVQLSFEGASAFVIKNRDRLQTLRFDGKVHMYSSHANRAWSHFLLQAIAACSNLSVQFTRRTTLLSWRWSDGWRSVETFDPNSSYHEYSPEWEMIFQVLPKTLISRGEVLSLVDYHERLPDQFNPFMEMPRFENWSLRTGDGSLVVRKGLVVRDLIVDGIVSAPEREVKEEKSVVDRITNRLKLMRTKR